MIEQNEVQISPEKITDAVLDKNIDIHLIQKYFSMQGCLANSDWSCKTKNGKLLFHLQMLQS